MSSEGTDRLAPAAGEQLAEATAPRVLRSPRATAAPPVLNRATKATSPEALAPACPASDASQELREPRPHVARAPRPEIAHAEGLRRRLAIHGEALRSGAALELAAVEAVLGEADQALAGLGGLESSLPAGEREDVSAARAGLLDAALALTAAVQQFVPAGGQTVAAEPQARPPPAPKPQAAADTFEPAALRSARRGRFIWWLAASSLLAAAAYHGNAWLQRQEAVQKLPPSPLPGIPEGLNAARQPNGRVMLMLQAGHHVERERFEQFKAAQAERGWKVSELGPGAWVVEPDPARGRP